MGHGIRCNAICPGTVQSPSLDDRLAATGDAVAARAAFVARKPMGRIADAAEIARRLDLFHRPYHAALAGLIAAHAAPVIVAIHSFTPQLRGRAPRPWHVGVLSAGDRRLAHPLLALLGDEPYLCVGDNQPYSGHLPGDALDRHAVQPGRPHVLVEIRNDLIETPDQQRAWGQRLAPMLDAALANAEV